MTDFPHNDEEHPRNSPHHDLLIINPDGVLHRLQVEKRQDHPNEGRYVTAPEAAHYRDAGHRKVFNIARAQAFSDAGSALDDPPGTRNDRGPAFAMLPVKPEPASSNWTCYLINAQRLAYKNPWTQAAWNDEPDPGGPEQGSVERTAPNRGDFELLVAGPAGDVFLVRSQGKSRSVSLVDLSQEQDIWSLLRNGCVVGTAEYYNHPDGAPKVVPLVNAACMVAPQGGR
jgi:hypothetical protein